MVSAKEVSEPFFTFSKIDHRPRYSAMLALVYFVGFFIPFFDLGGIDIERFWIPLVYLRSLL